MSRRPSRVLSSIVLLTLLSLLFSSPVFAKRKAPKEEPAAEAAPPVEPKLFQSMKWRNIGPFRGGRSTAVAGVVGDRLTYYFGSTGGGVWKSTDAGTTWKNVSDGFMKTGSVGAVAVAPSDANVVYVGMGEAEIRGVASSHGDGVYRSRDAGKTWTHVGLGKTRQISTIRVHPSDPDLVYVAAQGSPWTATPERGVYRSRDGGDTWEQVLFVDASSGASDLSMDLSNPRILYAALWDHQRVPWKVRSGGPGSGIHKSTDGGDTWEKLEDGLPELMGKIGVAASPARPDRVWAIVEAEEGGLYRSEDAGKSWKLVNPDRLIQTRSWYYMKVFADPKDPETVYVLNAPMMRSVDGGVSFTRIRGPHGDHHDLWIDPEEPQRMINGNDGGANVSWNGGRTWSTQGNQPTAQFYRVTTDALFPYRVYGGQQDNTSVGILSRSFGPGIGREHWMDVGGCESAWVAFDPDDPRLVYATCIVGLISELDVETRSSRDIMAYPYLGLGMDGKDVRYRFNWNAPVVTSPHERSVIYHGANVLLRSEDRGHSWTAISPDLTRNELEKQGRGGGPITNEGAGGEIYNTILYVVPSPHEAGTIWVGTDDGLVQLTRDEGETWSDVTPEGIGEAMINAVELSPHDPATAWIAVSRYKMGDFTPLAYKTEDYGATWTLRTEGIGEEAWVRVVREDPARPGLLYAGTETGLYVSFDDGERWQEFQLNLPVVPVTDLVIHDNDLVASTQGRAFWILDDLTPLRQMDEAAEGDLVLLRPRDTIRLGGGGPKPPPGRGQNPPNGVQISYVLSEATVEAFEPSAPSEDDAEEEPAEEPPALKLEILDAEGNVMRTYPDPKAEDDGGDPPTGDDPPDPSKALPAEVGMNRVAWDFSREPVTRIPKLFSFTGFSGPWAPPGTYEVRLSLGEQVASQTFELLPDPRSSFTADDYAAQQRLVEEMWRTADELHATVKRVRAVRAQVEAQMKRVEDHPASEMITEAGEALVEALNDWEEAVVQAKTENFQDVINYPNPLGAQLLFVYMSAADADPPVMAGAEERYADLKAEWMDRQAEIESLLAENLAAFNALFLEHAVPAVLVPED